MNLLYERAEVPLPHQPPSGSVMKRPQIIKMSLLLRTANNIKWKKPSFLFSFFCLFHCQVGMKKSPGGQVAEMTNLEIGLR